MPDPVLDSLPRYGHPKRLVLEVAWSALTGRQRSVSDLAARLMAAAPVPPRVEHAEFIPAHQPFVVVANHFQRAGLNVWWGPLLVTYALALRSPARADARWGMASRWTYRPGDWLGQRLIEPLSAVAFPRIARAYGIIPMPPIPPRPHEVAARAQAVRAILALAREPDVPIGIVPEGRDTADSRLGAPPAGVGRFMLHIAKAGRLILPVGIAERNGTFVARFGPPFHLRAPAGGDKEAVDREISTRVMVGIGRCLPPELWGEFQSKIEASLASDPAGKPGA